MKLAGCSSCVHLSAASPRVGKQVVSLCYSLDITQSEEVFVNDVLQYTR